MAGSHELYELIGTLSRTEKRYCTMMLETGAGRKAKSCLRLFEILSSMRRLDEADVRAAVEGEPFARHLAVTKNHLYEHLLRSLRSFDAAKSTRRRIRALIEGAEVLSERGLHQQARGRLREARTLSERYEYLPEQLVIARLAWRINAHEGYVRVDEEDLRRQRAEVAGIMDQISNYWDYLYAWASLSFRLIRRGAVKSHTDRMSVDDPLVTLAPPLSLQARRLQLEALRLYYLVTSRHDRGYEHSVEALRIVESFPMADRMEQLNYVAVLYTHVMVSLKVGRYAEARRTFEKLRSLHPNGRSEQFHHAQLCFSCRLSLYLVDLDHEAIAAMAGELEEVCSLDEDGFSRQLRIGFTIELAAAQFANNHARAALQTLHPVINDCRPGFRDDMLCLARLLRLMIHFDLGDFEVLPYLIRSTYRFIARCRGLSVVDCVVLRFMRRLPNVATRHELTAELGRVRAELADATSDPGEREAAAVSCILPWLDAKITGRGYGEVVREENRAKAIDDEPEGTAPSSWPSTESDVDEMDERRAAVVSVA